jgi:hypothetical protein
LPFRTTTLTLPRVSLGAVTALIRCGAGVACVLATGARFVLTGAAVVLPPRRRSADPVTTSKTSSTAATTEATTAALRQKVGGIVGETGRRG